MNKFALLVGIANYENPRYRLQGPLNDVRNFRSALIGACGFDARNIATLTDRDASLDEILIHLEELLGASYGEGSGPCHLVFYYSGHGTQVPDTDGDEADHLDEAIVPWDFDGSKNSVITDDMIYERCRKYYREGMTIDLIYDSCFSGGMERAIHHKFISVDSRYSHLPKATKLVPVPSMVVWTASKENQVSEEQEFSYASMSQVEGVFTHYLVQAIKDHSDATRFAMIKLVRQKIKSDGFTQRPRLMGSKKLKSLPFMS
jgi:hypothetical protein